MPESMGIQILPHRLRAHKHRMVRGVRGDIGPYIVGFAHLKIEKF